MHCLAHIVKYILWIFNVAFLLCGVALITIGSIMLSNINDFSKYEDINEPKTLPILIIILGSMVFIISFFGCCGSIRENVCCISTYSVFMFIIFCLQLTLVVWMFVKREAFLKAMTDVVDKAWKHNDQAHGYPMNVIQVSFNCCGYNGYQDYIGKDVPSSCCGINVSSETGTCTPDIFQTKPGCFQTYKNFWAKNTDIIRFAGIIIALVELLAFTFACCLASNIKKSRGY